MHTQLHPAAASSPTALIGPGRSGVALAPRGGMTADPLGVDGVRMTYGRNEEIFGEGEPASCAYRVLSGVVRTYRILADGRRQIAQFFLAGEVFGLQEGAEHRTSAEAVGDCEVLAIRRSHLADRATTDAATAHKLWSLALDHLRRSEDHMLVLGRKNACERVAWFLMDMSERIPAPTRVDLPMSRQDMADFLGLTIETVSRTMTQLQDEGLIELPTCRQVMLKDREALLDLAS